MYKKKQLKTIQYYSLDYNIFTLRGIGSKYQKVIIALIIQYYNEIKIV